MRVITKKNGYTMTETLIVLAVTAAVFAFTVTILSGQMAKYRFRNSVITFNQMVTDAINDVQVGYFDPIKPSDYTGGGIDCGTSTVSGTSNCVYGGKLITIGSGKLTRTSLLTTETDFSDDSSDYIHMDNFSEYYEEPLPGGVDYKFPSPHSSLSFYVLYKNYEGTISEAGGAQDYSVFYDVANPSNDDLDTQSSGNDASVCLMDGDKKADVVIGLNGSMTTEVRYGDEAVSCP